MTIPSLTASMRAVFAAAALILAGSAVAQAQTTAPADQATPNPSASPAGQTNPRPGAPNAPQPASPQSPSGGPSQTRAVPSTSISHLPVIDFVVTFTQPGVFTNSTQLPVYDPIDLGGTVRIPVTRKLNLLFDRITGGTINQPLEQQLLPAPNLPKDTRDIILQYHATYAFDRFLSMDLGDSFRHRVWASAPGPNGTLNAISAQPFPFTLSSTEHHFAYLGFTYTTKPIKDLINSQFAFSLTGDAQNVDHHVAILCTAAFIAANANQCGGRLVNQVGYLDEKPGTDRWYETTQGITWIIPVDARHGTTFTLNDRWGALNFYENQPYPWHWDSALTYQLNKRFSPGFTLSLRHADYHEGLVGAPFANAPTNPLGGFVHVASWDIIGTFHLDTNSLFH